MLPIFLVFGIACKDLDGFAGSWQLEWQDSSGDSGGADTAPPQDSEAASPSDVDGDGYTAEGRDCDDTDPMVNPDATEVCDDVDNDCDDRVDNANGKVVTEIHPGNGTCSVEGGSANEDEYFVFMVEEVPCGASWYVACDAVDGSANIRRKSGAVVLDDCRRMRDSQSPDYDPDWPTDAWMCAWAVTHE